MLLKDYLRYVIKQRRQNFNTDSVNEALNILLVADWYSCVSQGKTITETNWSKGKKHILFLVRKQLADEGLKDKVKNAVTSPTVDEKEIISQAIKDAEALGIRKAVNNIFPVKHNHMKKDFMQILKLYRKQGN